MGDFPLYSYRVSEMSRERRQVLLSDIKFTSMVPEISRSADHLCHAEEDQTMKEPRYEPSAYRSSG